MIFRFLNFVFALAACGEESISRRVLRSPDSISCNYCLNL